MNIFDNLILNLILLIFPILIWFVYLIHNKNIGLEERELLFDFCIVSSLYLLIKFGYSNKILINVPLLIAYFKDKKRSSLILTLIVLILNFSYFNLFEYSLYYILSFIIINPIFKIIAIGFLMIILFIFNNLMVNLFSSILSFVIITFTIIIMIKKFKKIINYHLTLKDLEQEKQYQLSLFKITHEIKNPIAVCKGYLDMFDINNDSHSKKYVPILKSEIERVLILLNDFLHMTEIKIEKEIVDIVMIIEDVLDNFKIILKEKQIDCQFAFPENSIYIYGDYNRLSQVFINLIKNSIEAMDKNKNSVIKISCFKKDDGIYINVYDNGEGIDKELLPKIKTPFWTTKKNGTGLGVSLINEIVIAHNGVLNYSSKKGRETLVELKFPLP